MHNWGPKLADNLTQQPRQGARLTPGPKTKSPVPFIPPTPLSVVQACAVDGSEVVLPLVLAVHRQLKMTGREWTPLNKAVWTSAGNPAEKKRERILRVLKSRPDLLQVRQRKTATSHYEVAYGALWGGYPDKLPY